MNDETANAITYVINSCINDFIKSPLPVYVARALLQAAGMTVRQGASIGLVRSDAYTLLADHALYLRHRRP